MGQEPKSIEQRRYCALHLYMSCDDSCQCSISLLEGGDYNHHKKKRENKPWNIV